MATLIIPEMNPMKFLPVNPAQLQKYLSKNFYEHSFAAQIKPWQEPVKYCNKVQRSDVSNFQFNSDAPAVTVQIVDVFGVTISSQAAVQKSADVRNPGFFAYEASINWSLVPIGNYYVKVSITAVDFISEPVDLKEIHANTLYLEYRNTRYKENVIFETGITFSIRVPGSIGFLVPSSSDQIFNDQRYNSIVLSSRPYRNFRISFGGSWGVPDWVIDKINLIFSCNDVKIDGKSYSKASDTKFTLREEENYPMRGISFEVRESNTTSNISVMKNFTAYWTWYGPTQFGPQLFPSNQIFGPQEAFVTYKGSGVFADGAPVVANFAAAPPDSWLVMKEPIAQPLKTHYLNDAVFIEGSIPDSVIGTPGLNFNGLWRMYFTRKRVTFNPTKTTTFS